MASENDVGPGDRDSAPAAASSEFAGMSGETALFLLAGAVLIGFVAYKASNSETPTSP
jgi:hypothetical protein